MADGFWNRQPTLHPLEGMPKRQRSDYDFPPPGHGMLNYLSRDDDRDGPQVIKDTQTIGSAYDRYLQKAQLSSFISGEASTFGGGAGVGRNVGVGMHGFPSEEAGMMRGPGAVRPDLRPNGRGMGFGDHLPVDPMTRPGREMPPLPPDASNTLFVEGLSPDTTQREVAHIFRPFVGYKEVRLVNKEPKHRSGEPLVLCFVDFMNAACAATSLSALQGYRMDEHDPDSAYLRLQFARYPGPRSASGPGPKSASGPRRKR